MDLPQPVAVGGRFDAQVQPYSFARATLVLPHPESWDALEDPRVMAQPHSFAVATTVLPHPTLLEGLEHPPAVTQDSSPSGREPRDRRNRVTTVLPQPGEDFNSTVLAHPRRFAGAITVFPQPGAWKVLEHPWASTAPLLSRPVFSSAWMGLEQRPSPSRLNADVSWIIMVLPHPGT